MFLQCGEKFNLFISFSDMKKDGGGRDHVITEIYSVMRGGEYANLWFYGEGGKAGWGIKKLTACQRLLEGLSREERYDFLFQLKKRCTSWQYNFLKAYKITYNSIIIECKKLGKLFKILKK